MSIVTLSAAVVIAQFAIVLQEFVQDPRSEDPPALETTELLRRGSSPLMVAHVAVAMPAQMSVQDLEYWTWLLSIDSEMESSLRGCIEAHQAIDDEFRRTRMTAVFALAAKVSTPPAGLTLEGARSLARELASTRERVIAQLRSLEHEMFVACRKEDGEVSDVHAELQLQLEALRLQNFDQGIYGTLEGAKADIGRFLFEQCARIPASPSTETVRACVVDAQSALTELRRMHNAAFSRRLETGSRLMLAGGHLVRQGVAIPDTTVRDWSSARVAARKQFANTAQRIAELNLATLENVCVSIPPVEAALLRRVYLERVYGVFASNAWEIEQLKSAVELEADGAEFARFSDAILELEAASQANQRELQRVIDKYRRAELEIGGPSRTEWERASARVASLHALQRTQADAMLTILTATISTARDAAWETRCNAFRVESEVRARSQLDAIERYFSNPR